MRTIRTTLSSMAMIVLAVIATLASPAMAEDVANTFEPPAEMVCLFDVTPVQSADVLAVSEVHRMSPVPGAAYAMSGNSDGTPVPFGEDPLPLGGAAGHSTALGIRTALT